MTFEAPVIFSDVSDAVPRNTPGAIDTPLFSVCIPAYNRARHLPELLDSIFEQDYLNFEVLICEDESPERATIRRIVERYDDLHPGFIVYYENGQNIGYDGNVRQLVAKAKGVFCFFMGNDDVMCPGALATVAEVIHRNPDVGFVLKSYAWFDHFSDNVNQAVRYFEQEKRINAGRDAIKLCYRRSGVISGYIIRREPANRAATNRFDGTLYYQMHLTASVLAEYPAVATPKVLIMCRNGEPPDFGHSRSEKGKYVPGGYTPQARLNMIRGVLTIIQDLKRTHGIDLVADIQKDYANYFYVYIKDQLTLPLRRFAFLYWSYGRMGFFRYPMFHLYCWLAYCIGERRFDWMTRKIRQYLGRSPQFGFVGK